MLFAGRDNAGERDAGDLEQDVVNEHDEAPSDMPDVEADPAIGDGTGLADTGEPNAEKPDASSEEPRPQTRDDNDGTDSKNGGSSAPARSADGVKQPDARDDRPSRAFEVLRRSRNG
jgi:hypothetical protein